MTTDFYYSRLLAAARSRKKIKNIKHMLGDVVVVEMMDGSIKHIQWGDMFDYEQPLHKDKDNFFN